MSLQLRDGEMLRVEKKLERFSSVLLIARTFNEPLASEDFRHLLLVSLMSDRFEEQFQQYTAWADLID